MNDSPVELACYVAGIKVTSSKTLVVRSPYDAAVAGVVGLAGREQTELAIQSALRSRESLNRFERSSILERARQRLEERREEFARLITSESGLCLRETRYEVGRALDVLRFATMEALRDDGEIFSCDISPQGKARKILPSANHYRALSQLPHSITRSTRSRIKLLRRLRRDRR